MILVPVKNLNHAKQRLSAILDQRARTQLAQAMLHDVVEAIGSWQNRPDVAIVTCDPFALALPSHVPLHTMKGYTLSVAKQVLTGRMDAVIKTMEHNIGLV